MTGARRTLVALVVAAALGTVIPVDPGFGPARAADEGGEKKPEDGGKAGEDGGKTAEGGDRPAGPTDEEIREFCKSYEGSFAKMVDEEAIQGIEKLHGWYKNPATSEDGRKAILGAFGKIVRDRKREAVVERACKALADVGEDAAPLLRFVLDAALKQKSQPGGVIKEAFRALGRIASVKPADVKFLTDALKAKEDDVISKAAQALAGYAKAPGALRREIFEELLKISEGVFSAKENNDNNAKRRWNIWGEDVVDALQKLSRQAFTKMPEFRTWLNDKGPGGGKNPKTWADPEPEGK